MKISIKLTAVLLAFGVLSGCAHDTKHTGTHMALCATAGGIVGGLIGGASGDSDDAGAGIAAGAAAGALFCAVNHHPEHAPACSMEAPEGALLDANGCAFDSDNDGVVDGLDKCPGTPAGVQVDAMGCALDSDGDGVVDHLDECPGTPAGTAVDSKGCALPVAGETILSLTGVNFATNSAELTSHARTQLDNAINMLSEATNVVKVRVEGHTDSRGSASYNESLSTRRAVSVIQYLVRHGGIAADKLTAVGMGETSPVASNDTADGRAMNRRVDFVVSQ